MDVKEFLIGVLGKTLNMPADKVASLFNEDGTVKDTAVTEVLTLDASRIDIHNSDKKTEFDNGFKKAEREIKTLVEKEIKAKYGLTSDKKGIDLIDEIVTKEASKAVELEPEKVKLHPEYLRMQDELTKQVKESTTTWQQKYESREKEISREQTFSVISKKADGILSGFGLPEDVTLANNQKALLNMELNKYNFQQNGEDWIILDSEGKVVNDQHGHRKNFETLVNEVASKYWPKKDGKPRQSSGAANNNGQGTGTPPANQWIGKITDEASYSKAMASAKSSEERIAIDDAYSKAQEVI